jgi:hypothetical protein
MREQGGTGDAARRWGRHGTVGAALGTVLGTLVGVLVALPLMPAVSSPDGRSRAEAAVASSARTIADALGGPPPRTPAPGALPEGRAQAAVDAADTFAGGSLELAAAVLDRATGELAVNGRGDEPLYAASLSKLLIVVDMLDRRRLEGLILSDDDLALAGRALGPSDDAAMNALWERFDGPGAPARLTARLGLRGTSAPRRAGEWGETESTAGDFVRLWRHVLDEMSADDRELLLTAMDAAPALADDGFDQAYGLLTPAVRGPGGPGSVAKQGWLCCLGDVYYLHSAGAVGADRRFVVALLTREPRSGSWVPARAKLDDIAQRAVAALE